MDNNTDIVPDTHPLSVLINIDDPESYITKKEIIEGLRPSDSSIDIIGVVTNVQTSYATEKDGHSMRVFNFVIECDGVSLPVAVWDDDIERIKPFVQLNMIIHLDSPVTRAQNASRWTYGRNFSLTCRSNTIINTLGKVALPIPDEVKEYQEFSRIEDCVSSVENNKIIVLNVAIKTEFQKESERSNKRIGAVADDETKLVVYIMDYDSTDELKKGQQVKMRGRLIEVNTKIHLEVQSFNDIQKVDKEKVSEEVLDKIFKTPKRKLTLRNLKEEKETGSTDEKKAKMD